MFTAWLREELEKREWSQNELARRAGLTSASVSYVLNELRGPGPEFCQAIAQALRLPEEFVFRQAGLLAPVPPDAQVGPLVEWLYALARLPQSAAYLAELKAAVIAYYYLALTDDKGQLPAEQLQRLHTLAAALPPARLQAVLDELARANVEPQAVEEE